MEREEAKGPRLGPPSSSTPLIVAAEKNLETIGYFSPATATLQALEKKRFRRVRIWTSTPAISAFAPITFSEDCKSPTRSCSRPATFLRRWVGLREGTNTSRCAPGWNGCSGRSLFLKGRFTTRESNLGWSANGRVPREATKNECSSAKAG